MTNPTDLARACLDGMNDFRRPVAIVATRMPWGQMEASIAPHLRRKPPAGRHSVTPDLFGTTLQIAGPDLSPAGRLRSPIRLMVSLLYLKHAYGLSDNEVVDRWAQDVLLQFFSDQEYFEHRLPRDSSLISHFRKDLGEPGLEDLLKTTIETAVAISSVKKTDLQRVIVVRRCQKKLLPTPPTVVLGMSCESSSCGWPNTMAAL